MNSVIRVSWSIYNRTSFPSNRWTKKLLRSKRNTSPLMVSMPCRVSFLHFTTLGWPPFRSAQGSGFILSTACVALARLRHSTTLHEMIPMIWGIETMVISSVKGIRIDVTIRAPESCPLSNCDQIAKMFESFGDESLGQERNTKASWNLSVAKHDRRASEV